MRLWLFVAISFLSSTVFARIAQVGEASSVAARQSIAEAEAQVAESETLSKSSRSKEPGLKGYWEIYGGIGWGKAAIGQSSIGILPGITDKLVQDEGSRWRSAEGRIGFGYVYFLNNPQTRFTNNLEWFPMVEPTMNIYFFNARAHGSVYLLGINQFNTNQFTVPVKGINWTIDGNLALFSYKQLKLIVLGGGGVAYTKNHYEDVPRSSAPFARFGLSTANRYTTNGVYEWGAQINYAIDACVSLSLAYLYTHVGNFNTSKHAVINSTPLELTSPAGFSLRLQTIWIDLHWAVT